LDGDPSEAAQPLDAEMACRLESIIDSLIDTGEAESALSLVNPHVQGRDAGEAILFAAALLQAKAGDETIARQLFSHLCEQAEQKKRWEALGAAVTRAVRHTGSPEFARVAARLWEKGGSEHAPVDLLREAFALAPDDQRVLWSLGHALIEKEETEGYHLIARSLPGFARRKETERIEEGVLDLIEKPDRESLGPVIETIDLLIRGGDDEAALTLLELVLPGILEHRLGESCWAVVRRALEKSPEHESYRPFATRVGVAAHAHIRAPERLFETAGIADKEKAITDALAMLDKLLELPPGRHVFHTSWGVGEIRSNDGENLRIHFEQKDMHRMSVALAKTALILLDPTDLRAKVYQDRDGMLASLNENRAEFLYHALEHLKGEATQDEVKKLLVTLGILDASKWADWWKNAKKEAQKDERFDFSQIFRKVIRIRSDRGNGSLLPEVDLLTGNGRKPLDLLFRFLEQHPEEGEHLADRFGAELAGLVMDGQKPSAIRLQAHLLLRRVGREGDAPIDEALDAFLRDPDLTTFSTDQQKALLENAPAERKPAVTCILLDSKVLAVRRAAWESLLAMDERRRQREIEAVLTGSPCRGNAVIHAVRELLGGESPAVWTYLHALIHVIEKPEKETQQKQALDLVRSEPFRKAAREVEPSPEDAGYLRNRLLSWKHSERFLFPILEMLTDSRLAEVVGEVEEKRASLRPKATTDVHDRFGGRIFMSKVTLDRIVAEADELAWDLKTTIPQEIRKAREHGDLRENAEYDAAKAKQADASKRLEKLYERIRLSGTIEELEILEDEIGPGVEVELTAADGARLSFWMLGEGDRDLGENVISYRAPLGALLLGKKLNEEVGPIEEKNYRVTAIHKRLPKPAVKADAVSNDNQTG